MEGKPKKITHLIGGIWGKMMSSLVGVDLEHFILRVRHLNLSPFEHLGVAERWCPFSASAADPMKGTQSIFW